MQTPRTDGDAVRRHRKRLGLSIRELAKRCGLHETQITHVEHKRRSFTLADQAVVAREFGICTDDLLVWADTPATVPVGDQQVPA